MGLKIDESHWLLGFPVPVFLDYKASNCLINNYHYFSCLFITFKGEWLFKNFDKTNPASFNNDMLLLSTSLSIFSMINGTRVGIRSIRRIRKCLQKMWDLNEATLCKALKNEKACQNRPKMAVEYQQDFSEESATDALLVRKQAVTYVFLDSHGKIEKMETALPNGTVAKITPEKKALIENDGIERNAGATPKVAETSV